MKRKGKLILGLAFVFMLFDWSLTTNLARAAYLAKEIEVTIGEEATGHIEGGTSDIFVFKPEQCGELTISIKCEIEDRVTSYLYSDYNKDHPLLDGAEYDSWEGNTVIKYNVIVSPRTYYLRLTNPITINNGEITVTSELTPLQSDEAKAVNNVRLEAVALKNNKFYHGVLAFDETEDYYLIHLSKEMPIKFTVTSAKEEVTSIKLTDYRGEVIDQGDIYGDIRSFTFRKQLPEGKYYLIINKGSLVEHTGKTYEIVTGNYLLITKVSIPKSKSLNIGDSYTIKPVITPKKATEEYTFSSSDNKVVKVTSSGKLTALKKGTATITLCTEDGKIKRFCRVTVK